MNVIFYLTQGHHWILTGLFFGIWTTPIHSYGLPAEVHTAVNIFINFSFIPEPSNAPIGRAACYLLNFRDDFDSTT